MASIPSYSQRPTGKVLFSYVVLCFFFFDKKKDERENKWNEKEKTRLTQQHDWALLLPAPFGRVYMPFFHPFVYRLFSYFVPDWGWASLAHRARTFRNSWIASDETVHYDYDLLVKLSD